MSEEVLLKHTEAAMLETIRRAGATGISTVEASKIIGYTPAGGNYILVKLAQKGLIKKTKSVGDRTVLWMMNNGNENYVPLDEIRADRVYPTEEIPEVEEVESPQRALVGRERILEELIETEIRLRQLDDEFRRRREELTIKSKNLKAQILVKVVTPKAPPKQHIKRSTRRDQTLQAAQIMQEHHDPITLGELATLMEVEPAVVRSCVAELVRTRVVTRDSDGRYSLVVHPDASVSGAASPG